jgi:uncharacterized repeat protein (TIGR03803 family)
MAGCSRMPAASSLPPGSPSQPQVRNAQSSGFTTLIHFDKNDGQVPVGVLLGLDGELFGTTYQGGDRNCHPRTGCGTVFKLSASGVEKVLHNFGNPSRGKEYGVYPWAGLVDLNGSLYGTTQEGGKYNDGTVYYLTAGKFYRLFSFNGQDGNYPRAGLTIVNGVLYGTTYLGGKNGYGTVFSITTAGVETVLHSFGAGEGHFPLGVLIPVGSKLYGTTLAGGASNQGTVFEIGATGKERVVYSFKGTPDGAQPYAGLTDVNGTLYGTTFKGGTNNFGTVYTITRTGTENVIHSFVSGSDGARPYAGVTELNGQLYGVTSHGGTATVCAGGCGTVYSMTPSGAETVLYTFTGTTDGASPYASLADINGALYGSTLFLKGGTVFEFTP